MVKHFLVERCWNYTGDKSDHRHQRQNKLVRFPANPPSTNFSFFLFIYFFYASLVWGFLQFLFDWLVIGLTTLFSDILPTFSL